jgi:hypothetical protein
MFDGLTGFEVELPMRPNIETLRSHCLAGHDLTVAGTLTGSSNTFGVLQRTCRACEALHVSRDSWALIDVRRQAQLPLTAHDGSRVEVVLVPPLVPAGLGALELRRGGQLFGRANLLMCGTCRKAVLADLIVPEAHRHRGVGWTLVEAVRARTAGFDVSMVHPDLTDPVLRSFWARVGYLGRGPAATSSPPAGHTPPSPKPASPFPHPAPPPRPCRLRRPRPRAEPMAPLTRSLTTRLARGELARWCTGRSAGVGNLAAGAHRRLAAAGHPDPVHPRRARARRAGRGRVRPAPRAAHRGSRARRGAARPGPGWAELVAAGFGPSRLPEKAAGRFSPYQRPVPRPPATASATALPTGEHRPVLEEFVARTARCAAEHTPPGALGAEIALARTCWVLGGWEIGYRTGRLPKALAAVHAHPGYTVEDLRAAAPEPVVAELVELVRVLHTSTTLSGWRGDAPGRPVAAGPLGIAAPVIVAG